MPTEKRLRGRPRSFNDNRAQNTVQSLDRALDVLELLTDQGSRTLTGISAALEQSPATIYRMLTTFQLRGVVRMNPTTQEWNIGPEAYRIGSAFLRQGGLIERSRPFMHTLMEETRETANLGIEKSDEVLFVSQVETHETIRAFFPPGTQSPMHASGIGKALLSMYSEERFERLLKKMRLEAFTEFTITDRDRLRDEMLRIRQQGYSFDNEERTVGMRCVAAPITNVHGEVIAGISVSGPSHRMTLERVPGMGAIVRQAADATSQGAVAMQGMER
ncbi:HTH-type transcriptional regulator BhcR [Amaricoccus tamworthensis]|uniref:HTH-type transcriptional regulator BhcR n=1 Tax=Amaricoccus tamworthensis TaxID=57002 RepID=UPI003C7D0B60